MLSFPLIIIFSAVILVWLSVLSIFLLKIRAHYNSLIKGSDEGNLEAILRKVLTTQEVNKKEISEIKEKITAINKSGLGYIQKIGMLRFNPFNETGGDNSFTLALMDANFNGIVLTGLHTREKTRMYAKEIRKGMSKYELSREERKAIEIAVK